MKKATSTAETCMNCIETDNLSCDVAGHRLFEGLTLRVERGQRVRIAGPSGCGKTTLLKTFMGFVPAASGTIRIEGVELNDASVWTLRHKLAYLAQEPDLGAGLVLPRFREPFAYRRNADVHFDADRLGQWLDFFYLPDAILHKELKSLSGGEKQRLALILAILLGRTIFLLDEPVSAMDAAGRKRFLQVFQEHPDWTAVFISHDESLAEMADHTIDLAAKGDRP